MFDNLTNKIESAFAYFNKITRLDEKQADEGLRKIRQALLESDVALSVTKKFIENVKPKIIGKEVLKSVTPGQMIVKICLLYTSPSPRDVEESRMPSSA